MHIFDRGSQSYIVNPETGLPVRTYSGHEGQVAQSSRADVFPTPINRLFEPEDAEEKRGGAN